MLDRRRLNVGKELQPCFYIATFGCQMNMRDSEVLSGLLNRAGFTLTNKPEKADIIIFNTCSVRQHAEDRVFSLIGEYKKRQKKKMPGTVPIIGLIGCMAKNYQDKIFNKAPDVDFVVGPSDIAKIPEIIERLLASKKKEPSLFQLKIWETDGEARPEEIYHTGFYEDKKHAYLVISEGCSNFCSYCVVPYVRGPLRHRHYKDILAEIEEAIDKGVSEITLLGQNVNAYQYEGVNFVGLVELVNSVKGLKEFGFMTSHPKDASSDLFKAISGLDKLKKSLHLPIQSGSDRILKLMNRGYSKRFYLDLVDNYRKIVGGGTLTTDIIIGFPSESEADFKETYNLVKDVGFNSAYIFKYSLRPHTEAVKMPDDVTKKEKEGRHALILELQRSISERKRC
jgi:tRNA-2-methylthio-N6-dimethylallyladenosine synthase